MVAQVIIAALLVPLLLGTGAGKLRQLPSSLAIRDSLRLSNRTWKTIGTLEIGAVVGLVAGVWLPLAGLAASAGVGALMVGAIVVRARAGQRNAAPYVADVVVLLIALASVGLHALAV